MDQKLDIARSVCCAPDVGVATMRFFENYDSLNDFTFVFAVDGDSALPDHMFRKEFAAKEPIYICSLFSKPKLITIDKELAVDTILKGSVQYPCVHLVMLDNMILGNLSKAFCKETYQVDENYKEIFDFMAMNTVMTDPLPYILENIPAMMTAERRPLILETLRNYEVLRTIDAEYYQKTGNIKSLWSEKDREENVQGIVSSMETQSRDFRNSPINAMYRMRYVLLLKMIQIQFKYQRSTVEERFARFLEFCNNEYHAVPLRSVALSKSYFEKGHQLRFFKHIQKKKPNIIEHIRNMAWDLFHVTLMETQLSTDDDNEARIIFPSFLTSDKGLREIIMDYSLDAIGFTKDGRCTIPGAKWSLEDPRFDLSKYYSADYIAQRAIHYGTSKSYDDLILQLENEIRSYI